MAEIKIEIVIYWLNIVKISVPGYWSNMEYFLVYLFNFYYAISELEQNKQNNTIIFFLLFIFLTKKWTSAVCGGVRAHPSHPSSLRAWDEKLASVMLTITGADRRFRLFDRLISTVLQRLLLARYSCRMYVLFSVSLEMEKKRSILFVL